MTQTEFDMLRPGDVVRPVNSNRRYIVHDCHGNGVIVVRTMTMTNPDEWEWVEDAKDYIENPIEEEA